MREILPIVVENQRSPLYYCLTANVKTLLAVNFNLMTSLLYDQPRKQREIQAYNTSTL